MRQQSPDGEHRHVRQYASHPDCRARRVVDSPFSCLGQETRDRVVARRRVGTVADRFVHETVGERMPRHVDRVGPGPRVEVSPPCVAVIESAPLPVWTVCGAAPVAITVSAPVVGACGEIAADAERCIVGAGQCQRVAGGHRAGVDDAQTRPGRLGPNIRVLAK